MIINQPTVPWYLRLRINQQVDTYMSWQVQSSKRWAGRSPKPAQGMDGMPFHSTDWPKKKKKQHIIAFK